MLSNRLKADTIEFTDSLTIYEKIIYLEKQISRVSREVNQARKEAREGTSGVLRKVSSTRDSMLEALKGVKEMSERHLAEHTHPDITHKISLLSIPRGTRSIPFDNTHTSLLSFNVEDALVELDGKVADKNSMPVARIDNDIATLRGELEELRNQPLPRCKTMSFLHSKSYTTPFISDSTSNVKYKNCVFSSSASFLRATHLLFEDCVFLEGVSLQDTVATFTGCVFSSVCKILDVKTDILFSHCTFSHILNIVGGKCSLRMCKVSGPFISTSMDVVATCSELPKKEIKNVTLVECTIPEKPIEKTKTVVLPEKVVEHNTVKEIVIQEPSSTAEKLEELENDIQTLGHLIPRMTDEVLCRVNTLLDRRLKNAN